MAKYLMRVASTAVTYYDENDMPICIRAAGIAQMNREKVTRDAVVLVERTFTAPTVKQLYALVTNFQRNHLTDLTNEAIERLGVDLTATDAYGNPVTFLDNEAERIK